MPVLEREQFNAILEKLPSLRIAVAGDLFLDKWLEIDRSLDEPSVETGLTAWQVVRKRLYAGAAGTVLSNLAALGTGTLYAVGFTGDDGEGFELRRILKSLCVDTSHVVVSPDLMTPVYTKPVFSENGAVKEINRLDHRNTKPTPDGVERRIIASLHELRSQVDAIMVLDQITREGYGTITPVVRDELAKIAQDSEIIVYADSRAFIGKFKNMVIKCNDHEALAMVQGKRLPIGETADLDEAGNCLLKLAENSGREAFVSCGPRGILVRGKDRKPLLVPAVPVPDPIDIVGAGDACSSGIVAALCYGAGPEEAAFLGNLAASITIQVIGATGTASREQLRRRYEEAARG
jgi:bifunctional ADP-heptose synthase (sugar kinase/adenylyltransferase)